MKVRWGVLGVAKIATEKVIPAMQRGQWSDVTAIASRELAKARTAATALGIPKAYGSYERPAERPGHRRHLQPPPQPPARALDDEGGRARQARALREAARADAAEARNAHRRPRSHGVRMQEAFMVRTHPQWLQGAALVREAAHWRSALDARRVQLLQPRSGEHPQCPGVRRRRAHGHRLLPDQHRALRFRARARARHRRRSTAIRTSAWIA